MNRTYMALPNVTLENKTYYINNDLVDPSSAFLALNCEDKDEALSALVNWQQDKSVSRTDADLSASIRVPNVYEYQSATDIKPRGYIRPGNDTCILGYSLGPESTLFTVLLA